ncbi:uncharacterized protein LOC110723990 [Chenopodium quinoa]|uniref:uncharacterized protein LOC110723990 n=1 Tax=Chenopodium quinoa TaxID=63459 RepID=UPI000B782C0D|nr:uncharacterized protein LOC110723990 [Chenopodium quinoa]
MALVNQTIKELATPDLEQEPLGIDFPTWRLCYSCPQHQISEQLLIQYFYDGLLPNDMNMIDAASGGALVDKTPEQATKLISNMAQNSQRYGTRNDVVSKRVNEVGVQNLEASLAENSRQISQFTNLVSNLVSGTQVVVVCGIFNDNTQHNVACPTLEVNELNLRYGNKENPSSFNQNQSNFRRTYNVQQPTNNQGSNSSSNLEELVRQLALPTDARLKTLETQIGQIATHVNSSTSQNSNKLPSKSFVNPKESANAVTLRNGNELEEPKKKERVNRELEQEQVVEPAKELEQEQGKLAKSKKEDADKEILETFRKVEVNIPLMDAIKQVPRYAKFLKELCTSMKKLIGTQKVEDVLVQGNELVFPADFYILDMGDEHAINRREVPLLLGRPFLKTSKTMIHVHEGNLTMEFDGDIIMFNIFDAMRYPTDVDSVCSIDTIDLLAQKMFELNREDDLELLIQESLDKNSVKEHETNLIDNELMGAINSISSSPQLKPKALIIDIPFSNEKLVPSLVQAPKLELKPLPDNLKYVYLGDGETLHVIITNALLLPKKNAY